MISVVSAIRRMLDMGLSMDQALTAAAAFEAEMPLDERQKSAGSRRQARYRERHKASQSVTTVTEVTDNVTSDAPFPDKEIPQTPKEITPNQEVSSLRSESHPTPPKKAKRAQPAYSIAFSTFWEGYPTDKNMSKSETWPIWGEFSAEDQAKAIASLPAFRSYCTGKPDYRPIHAIRYLKFRRFDGFSEAVAAVETSATAPVPIASPAYAPLLYRFRKERGHDPPMNGTTASFPAPWVNKAYEIYGTPQ